MFDLLNEVYNQPHLVTPARLDQIEHFLHSRKEGLELRLPEGMPKPQAYSGEGAVLHKDGYYIDGDIAIIDMMGTMLHRGGYLSAYSGVTSYERLSRVFTKAVNARNIKAILLNTDSPGGMVAGAYDLADKVMTARDNKPVYAIATDMMASAAYLIGAGAQKIHTTQTGQIGSIGVVMKHVDYSEMNKKIGVNPTYIYAGKAKVDGNPEEPLPKDVKNKFQAEIDKLYQMFVNHVAKARDMKASEVMATEASIYLGKDAIDAGLAESVTTIENLLEEMKSTFSSTAAASRRYAASTTNEVTTMSNETDADLQQSSENIQASESEQTQENVSTGSENIQASESEQTQENVSTGEALPVLQQIPSLHDQGIVQAIKSERERFATVMNDDAFASHVAAATAFLTKTDMTAEDILETLASMPAQVQGSSLDQLMTGDNVPNIGMDVENVDQSQSDADRIACAYKQARGL